MLNHPRTIFQEDNTPCVLGIYWFVYTPCLEIECAPLRVSQQLGGGSILDRECDTSIASIIFVYSKSNNTSNSIVRLRISARPRFHGINALITLSMDRSLTKRMRSRIYFKFRPVSWSAIGRVDSNSTSSTPYISDTILPLQLYGYCPLEQRQHQINCASEQ